MEAEERTEIKLRYLIGGGLEALHEANQQMVKYFRVPVGNS